MAINPEENKTEANLAYDELAVLVPELGSEDSEIGDGIEHNTVTQAMAHPNLTDMQVYDARMFPDTGYPYLNMLEVAENFPENFDAIESMNIKHLLYENELMSYVEARAVVHTAMSIGFTREGRMDEIEGLGHARTNRENESNKGLGA